MLSSGLVQNGELTIERNPLQWTADLVAAWAIGVPEMPALLGQHIIQLNVRGDV